MKIVKNVIFGILCLSASALGSPTSAPMEEAPSRALQLARRVASMENDKDLPSRAVWLGQRAAKNSKIAMKRNRKKSPSLQN